MEWAHEEWKKSEMKYNSRKRDLETNRREAYKPRKHMESEFREARREEEHRWYYYKDVVKQYHKYGKYGGRLR